MTQELQKLKDYIESQLNPKVWEVKDILRCIDELATHPPQGLAWVKAKPGDTFNSRSIVRFIYTKFILHEVNNFIEQYPERIDTIEYLDESAAAPKWVNFLPILQENWQAKIAGYYNIAKDDNERKIWNALVEEYRDLILIYKSKMESATPSPSGEGQQTDAVGKEVGDLKIKLGQLAFKHMEAMKLLCEITGLSILGHTIEQHREQFEKDKKQSNK